MLDRMRSDLKNQGVDAWFVTINKSDAVANQAALLSRCDFPVLQDSDAVQAWTAVFGGYKDDIYIYDSDGKLFKYLPFGGAQDTTLSNPDTYAAIKQLVIQAGAKTAKQP
ncbi:MAG: hypothetical protein HY902_15365 [Deltaproteobacteria bacterium]|nr:hypothetical protein [Deltaproteobacteria bacterium]